MEKKLQEAESTREPFALRQQLIMLAAHRPQFSKELEARFLALCQRLKANIHSTMPAA
jgi:hypothetical protein